MVLGRPVAKDAVFALVRGYHESSGEVDDVANNCVLLTLRRADSATECRAGTIWGR